jgi:predicted DNA binding CopG/RHH family protein
MNDFILDDEEQEILAAFEAGELKSIPNVEEQLNLHRQIAAATLTQEAAHLDIALSVNDFEVLKRFAVKDGVANYQAFAEGIVRRYLQERLEMAG